MNDIIYQIVATAPRAYKVTVVQTIYQGPVKRPARRIQSNSPAVAADAMRKIDLDGSQREVEYTIDPVLMQNSLWPVRCINNDNAVTIHALTGTIENKNGYDQVRVEMLLREAFWIYANGTNIEIL